MASLADFSSFALAFVVVGQVKASRPISTRRACAKILSNLSFTELAVKSGQTVADSSIVDLVAVGSVQAIFLVAGVVKDFAEFAVELGWAFTDSSFVDDTASTSVEARRDRAQVLH